MSKEYILVVEDEHVIYESIRDFLVQYSFEVAPYTKDVHEALKRIKARKPDLVTIDLSLDGIRTSFDLGKILKEKYSIPHIYVTSRQDDISFGQGLSTHPYGWIEKLDFLEGDSSTKLKDLLRTIYTALQHSKPKGLKKKAIWLYTEEGYLDFGAEYGERKFEGRSYKELISVERIVKFSKPDKQGIISTNPAANVKELRKHSLQVQLADNSTYFIRASLRNIENVMPDTFVRINNSIILNISPEYCTSRISSSRIVVHKQEYTISKTYWDRVNSRFNDLYLPSDLTR